MELVNLKVPKDNFKPLKFRYIWWKMFIFIFKCFNFDRLFSQKK